MERPYPTVPLQADGKMELEEFIAGLDALGTTRGC
jgi:hypothetical protein